jgi:phenylpyruvate tautomerase PptA (4-oxalocrotonate tautomerase family)
MPFINSKLTVKLSEANKENLKAKMGDIISEIPGKSEEWLMVSFNDGDTIYFRGNKMDKAAFIDVRIFGKAERQHKNKVAQLLCSLLESEINIPQENIYVTFSEVEDWGWNGELF